MPIQKIINKNFFKTWTYDMAYILGFMFADGSITINNRGAYYFALYSSDRNLLEEIKNKMSSGHKVSKRSVRSGYVFRLQVGSKEMVYDLKKYGFHENKVKRMRLPTVPYDFLAAFICGFFDGDGNVWVGTVSHKKGFKKNITIQSSFTSASMFFLRDLYSLLKKLGIIGGSLYKIKNKICSRLTFSVNDSLKLYEIMYNKSHTFLCLIRKRKMFERYIKLRKMRP